jgi:TRAP-type C4-dicarboxylate transport system permease large subunit
MKDIILGTLPFVGASIANLWLLVAFPQIALFLPGLMK